MFINGTIRDYVDKASAATPTPGGGSISALAGALGASMACMAANFTVGRKKFKAVEPAVRAILRRIEDARERLLQLTEEDSRAYEKFSAALSMPKETDEEKAVREQALQGAVREAMAVPLNIVRVCSDVLRDLTELVGIANPNLISDVGVAAVLVEGALRGAKLNVEINLAYLKDEELESNVRKELNEQRSRAASDLRAVAEKVAAAIGGTP